MPLLPRHPREWSDDELETSFWRYFEAGTLAHAVALLAVVAFAWPLVSMSLFPDAEPHREYASYGIFVAIVARLYAQQVDAVREFLTRHRAKLAEAPLDEFIPPRGRLGKAVAKAYNTTLILLLVAAVGLLIHHTLGAG